MRCFISSCNFSVDSLTRLFSHYRNFHGFGAGSELSCSFEKCHRIFLSFYALKKHIESHHQADLSTSNYSDVPVLDQCADNFSDACSNTDYSESVFFGGDFEQSLMHFFVQLQSKANMTLSNVQSVAENIAEVIDEIACYSVNVVHNLCASLSIDKNHPRVSAACEKLAAVKNAVYKLDTNYKRNKWLEERGYLTKPVQVTLGASEVRLYSGVKEAYSSVLREDVYQLVPLDKLLGKLLECSNAGLIRDFKQLGNTDGYLKEFFDGDFYRENLYLYRHPDAIILHFFIDAFETVNPLGSHTAVHKLEGLYCVIRNLPREVLSKTCNIFLVGLWYASYVKCYGYDKILQPLFVQLKQLESEKGLPVTIKGKESRIHGILGIFSADNLGAHSLFGFLESFAANKFCRFCNASKDEVQSKFLSSQFVRRNRESVDLTCENLKSSNYNPSETGIKRSCILNSLDYFHCTDQSVVDCMHDLLEGIVPFELSHILSSLISKQFFTLDELNCALAHFEYSASDINSKPPPVSLSNLRIQAAESWCLVRNLPLIIGNKVPFDDESWDVLLLLLDCIDIVFAPVVTHGVADLLSYLIEDHHLKFKSVFPNSRLIPKHHFLIHYPEFIKKFGPLSQYWCMRFEAKHRFGKELASSVRNFKNICKTVADRSQLELAYNLLSGRLFTSDHVVNGCTTVLVNSLNPVLSACIINNIGLCSHDEVHVATNVVVGHYKFRTGAFVVLQCNDGLPIFGKVCLMFKTDCGVYFVCNKTNTLNFFRHFHSFSIEISNDYIVVLSSELHDYHPLMAHKVAFEGTDYLVVSPRYKLLQ